MKDAPACVKPAARYLLLATDDVKQGRHSGYTRISNYIQQSRLITARRSEPGQGIERVTTHILDMLAASPWYRIGSLKLEWQAWSRVQAGFRGLLHLMWAERDWGFLDKFPSRSRLLLCATFHGCPDTLLTVIKNTKRLHNFAAIILVSEVQRSFFESCGVPAERIHVIHHGVDCGYFSPCLKTRLSGFTVLFVGSYRRNFAVLREVCERLEHYEYISIRLVVPESRFKMFQHLKNVILVSGLSDDELRASYREASCLLMTAEGATANNAILEAMACGLPIVSEDVGGIAEYTGTNCAILCEPRSAEALTNSILLLSRQPNLVAHMGLLARERAEELDWPLVAARTVRLYEKVLAKS
jgi:glycosyltransferase involved in cell wall biosynthesis